MMTSTNPITKFSSTNPCNFKNPAFTPEVTEDGKLSLLVRAIGAGTRVLEVNSSALDPSEWRLVESILSRPADRISQPTFTYLAGIFVALEYYLDKQRFVNLFLEPVTPPNVSNPFGVNAFSICPQKVGGVMGVIGNGIRAIGDAQMGLSTRSQIYSDLQNARDHLKESYALLSIINGLTSSVTVRDSGITPSIGLQQNVLLGIGDIPPITLTQNLHSTTVTFNRGEVFGYIRNEYSRNDQFGVGIRPASTTVPSGWYGGVHTSHINSNSITMSDVHGGAGLGRGLINATGNHFHAQHQFDMGRFAIQQVAGVAIGIATAGLGSAASTAAGIVAGLPVARNDARNVQNDIIDMTNNALFATFQEHFGFRGVVITSTDQPPQVMSWPTANTLPSLNALNSVLENNSGNLGHITYPNSPDAITQPSFSWGQFMQDPNRVFEVYAALNGVGTGLLERQITANRADRNDRLESPSSQPPPDYLELEAN